MHWSPLTSFFLAICFVIFKEVSRLTWLILTGSGLTTRLTELLPSAMATDYYSVTVVVVVVAARLTATTTALLLTLALCCCCVTVPLSKAFS